MLYNNKRILKPSMLNLGRCMFSKKHQKVIFSRTKSMHPDQNQVNRGDHAPIFGTGYEESQYQRHPLESDLQGT